MPGERKCLVDVVNCPMGRKHGVGGEEKLEEGE